MKGAYNKNVNRSVGGYEEVFQMLWKMKGLPFSQICGWRVFHNKLSTRDKVHSLGILIVNLMCVLCNSCTESVCYLLLMCKTTCILWDMCDNWFEVQSVH